MSQAELLKLIIQVLDQLAIDAMLVGSYASSFYGEARTTHDIDIVIDLPVDKIDALVGCFPQPRYYLSQVALHEGRMANLIDTESGDKVDLWILADDPPARRVFETPESHYPGGRIVNCYHRGHDSLEASLE